MKILEKLNSDKFKSVLNTSKGQSFLFVIDRAALYLPGLFFVLLGTLAFIAPKLLGAIVAAMFIFLGTIFCFFVWKFLTLKKKVEGMIKNYGAQFIVRTYGAAPSEQDLLKAHNPRDDKKTILH
ncbi:MAG: hypothetical protein SGJ02_05330 [bacterium]|nr:hypothetical protein [bacterium]